MNISRPFINRPVATTLLTIAIALAGGIAYSVLPVSALPQVDFPTISVGAGLPGASADIVASSIATPLERQFAHIAGVTEMTSSSSLGSTAVTLQFDLSRDINGAARDVEAAINSARTYLPANLPGNPTYRKVNPADSPIMLLAVHSDTLPLIQTNDYADNILAQQISQITGVGLVNIGGAQKPAVRIQADPAKLAAMGMSLEDIRAVIANVSVNAPKGTLDGPTQSFTVYTNDQLLAAAPWNDIILAYKNGAPIRVKDIGVAVDAPENNKVAAWAYSGAAAPE
jgi:HAE1 family hydrophobic/amphiphilic exporter-1